jgi:anti-sigma factor RsiW
MLAYVDNCLPSESRLTFAARMAENPAIQSQVAQWLQQNEAIRAAFRDNLDKRPVASRAPPRRGPPGDWAPQDIRVLRAQRSAERLRSGEDTTDAPRKPAAAPAERAHGASRRWLRVGRRLVYALALWIGGAFAFADDQPAAFVAAGAAAYRTFAQSASRPVEVTAADPGVLRKWVAQQIGRAAPIPDLAAAGLTLLGGRIVPGAASPASFALYENAQRERVGLYAEALDSPPAAPVEVKACGDMLCASWSADGHGFALIGRLSPARMTELAHLIGGAQLKI